jgi:hypothetical protein
MVINLRILLGFAFLPAGIKKLIGEPFTDPAKRGAFHEFLHGFFNTGVFYNSTGALQLIISALYFWQASLVPPLLALPLLTAIMLFTWSTWVPVTAIAVTAMWLATIALFVWEIPRWRPVIFPSENRTIQPTPQLVAIGPWRLCGLLVALTYAALCWHAGQVYRPVPGGPKDIAFFVMSALPVLPLATLWYERYRT